MPERCLLNYIKKYNQLCPADCPDGTFYLKALDSPRSDQWYSRDPFGHNMLAKIVPQVCLKAGITGHITNHSLTATCVTRLYQQGIMENTGHQSVQGVRSYK